MRQETIEETPRATVPRTALAQDGDADAEAAEKASLQEAWGAVAAIYMEAAAPLTSQTGPALLAAAALRPRSEFLDLGCGVGALAAAAQIFGALATGVDLAPAMIAAADSSPSRRGAAFRIGDARALDARAGSFDAVAANFSILESGAPERVLAEAHRALREGGAFGWTLWPGPTGGRLFELVAAARAAALGGDASAARAIGGSAEAAKAMTEAAGFIDVAVRTVPLYLEARAEAALAAVESLDAPAGASEGAQRRLVLDALQAALTGLSLLETEAIIVTARKPDPNEEPAMEEAPVEAAAAAEEPEAAIETPEAGPPAIVASAIESPAEDLESPAVEAPPLETPVVESPAPAPAQEMPPAVEALMAQAAAAIAAPPPEAQEDPEQEGPESEAAEGEAAEAGPEESAEGADQEDEPSAPLLLEADAMTGRRPESEGAAPARRSRLKPARGGFLGVVGRRLSRGEGGEAEEDDAKKEEDEK